MHAHGSQGGRRGVALRRPISGPRMEAGNWPFHGREPQLASEGHLLMRMMERLNRSKTIKYRLELF